MQFLLFAVAAVMLLLILKRLLSFESEDEELDSEIGNLPYVKKKYILSSAEFHFYKALRIATDDKYLIVPQVHLEDLVEVMKGEKRWQTHFNKIIKKSVDFVLFDKDTVVALLAIELDDHTHSRERRKKRDGFVNRLFPQVGLKLWRLAPKETYDYAELRAQINYLIALR